MIVWFVTAKIRQSRRGCISGFIATFAEIICMSEPAWYKEWFGSPFYHKLYFERDEQEASEFIHRLVEYLKPAPGSRMLDVACGRGRHSRILASLGYEVTGIDISEESILYAGSLADGLTEFFVHDMRRPFRVNYYHYAFNLFTSFGYFKTRREHDDAIRTIAASLKPGGMFVLDYLNIHYAEDHLVPHESKKMDGTVYEISRWHDEFHFYKKIMIRDASLKHPAEYTEVVAKFNLSDFEEMLGLCRMQVVEVFGDYRLGRYDVKKTPRLVLVSKKN
jgi:SAM-dependent methyltransferase